MPNYELDCTTCGDATTVQRKNGKYCGSCALLTKLVHAAKTTRSATLRCRICQTRFAPLHNRDRLCADCDPATPSPHGEGTCVLCKQPRPFPFRGVTVCLGCVKDPDARAKTIAALRKGQAARTAANAGRERREITLVEEPNRDTATSRA